MKGLCICEECVSVCEECVSVCEECVCVGGGGRVWGLFKAPPGPWRGTHHPNQCSRQLETVSSWA